MQRIFFSIAVMLVASSVQAQSIQGAGATTASSLMKSWTEGYATAGGGTVVYTPNGSVAGLEAVVKGTAHFALTDARVSVRDLTANDLVQFPVAIEGIVPFVNVPGVTPGQLRLTGPVLADIYLGKVRMWNDAAIAGLNPGLTLPALAVQPVYRNEGSGSTFLFTSYLSSVSVEWKTRVGAEASVKWPTGLPAKGSDGVVETVKSQPGAIGFVDFGRVQKLGLAHVQLKNKAGAFVAASHEGFGAAAVAAPWSTAPSFAVVIVDMPGAGVWPVSGTVFAVMKRQQKDAGAGLSTLRFFDYALGEPGAAIARKGGQLPMPVSLANLVRDAWPRLIKTADGRSVWTAR